MLGEGNVITHLIVQPVTADHKNAATFEKLIGHLFSRFDFIRYIALQKCREGHNRTNGSIAGIIYLAAKVRRNSSVL